MKRYITTTLSSLLIIGLASLNSCKKEQDPPPSGYSVPITYSFDNVNFSGQTTRLGMLEEMLDYMKTSGTTGTVIDASILKNMYSNTGSPFTDAAFNSSGKQLKNKCFLPDQLLMEQYMDSLALASTSLVAGSNGTPGVVVSGINPAKKYCLSANGFDYTEMLEKGIMGGVFYYQAINTYLENLNSDDNITVVTGEGTAMQHHFDEAFGYFGVQVDFPSNTNDVLFWGEYCNDLNGHLGSNAKMMNAFLAARAAIVHSDYSTRDTKVQFIREYWDVIIAAAAIHEINEAMQYFADDALRNHTLSEFVGFVSALKYSSYKQITSAEITTILNYIGSNLYTVTYSDLTSARDLLSSIYNLDDIKTVL